MDIVYIVGNGSRWNNNELRYSLRSIEKNGIGLGRVFLVGTAPSFISDEVTVIPFEDDPGAAPAENVFHKMLFAMESGLLPEQFLVSSDDHFAITPADFAHWPLHYKGTHLPSSKDMGNRALGGKQYVSAIANTNDLLARFGYHTYYFEGHANKLYTMEAYRWLCRQGIICDAAEYAGGVSLNTPMAMAIHHLHPDYPCVKRKDLKVRQFSSRSDLETILQGTNMFSIGDEAISCGIGSFLQEMFPNPSKFEKNDL